MLESYGDEALRRTERLYRRNRRCERLHAGLDVIRAEGKVLMGLHWGEITAGVVLGIVIAQVLNHLFTKLRASAELTVAEQDEAVSEFKAAFSDALLNLSLAQHTVDHILKETFRDHEAAYHRFREYIPQRERKKFDEAWSMYKRYFKTNAKHAQQYQFASAKTDHESEQRKVAAALLKELLDFAKEE